MATEITEILMGRPPKPAHLKRTARVVILMTEEEAAALDEHVTNRDFADRSDFARPLILREIGYERRNPNAPGEKPSTPIKEEG